MKVFITGGTGSLGRGLLNHYNKLGHDEITVYSRDEVKQSELRALYPDVRFMLGDVRDYDRLLLAMRNADFVIHASAYKQVPSAEANVDEAIATNVLGSLNVARAAVHNNVGSVVGVSTDKACAPINAYGETKALMEKLFQQASVWGDTIFNCVRYGNVLGSRGSVVPLFVRQLQAGHVTLTDPGMTRFWMTLDEAVELIMIAADLDEMHEMQEGSVVVPLAPASSMDVLLQAVASAYGYSDGTYKVHCIGTRPGEKQHEQLVHANESMHTLVTHPGTGRGIGSTFYQIMPATTVGRNSGAGPPFEYRSDTAAQLSVAELAEMVLAGE